MKSAAFVVHSAVFIPSSPSRAEPSFQLFLPEQPLQPNLPADLSSFQDQHSSFPSNNMANYTKNINPFWAVTSCLAVWFLFVHAPAFWKQRQILQIRDILLGLHIVAAGTIYMTCLHNCVVTPFMSPTAFFLHTWVGRVGLVSGVISFATGAYMAWSRLTTDPTVVGGVTLGFSIPITIGGILQILCEVKGYQAIREYREIHTQLSSTKATSSSTTSDKLKQQQHDALCQHIGWMINLFVMACSIPAGIRLASLIAGTEDGILPTVLIIAIIFALQSIGSRFYAKMMKTMPKSKSL